MYVRMDGYMYGWMDVCMCGSRFGELLLHVLYCAGTGTGLDWYGTVQSSSIPSYPPSLKPSDQTNLSVTLSPVPGKQSTRRRMTEKLTLPYLAN